jgi:uncharacterized protein (DUF1015 family)
MGAMVDIAPFKALRYNPSKVSNLSNVICPPYDVISVPEYDRLMKRSPMNLVRVELPLAQSKIDRYGIAAGFWRKWQNQRVLVEDKQPAYYGYEQRFLVGTTPYFRRGFFAALRLEKPGHGSIRPHERTFPKHKEDRLRLMHATQSNISPIFGIFAGQKKIQSSIADWMSEKPLVTARDDRGVTHRLWRWNQPDRIQLLSGALRGREVLIADGHHRYETAWNFAQEMAGRRKAAGKRAAFNYVMTFLCPLEDPGLVIQPTHRSVRWDASLNDWENRVDSAFTMRKAASLSTILSQLRDKQENTAMGMVVGGGKLFWLTPKNGKATLPVVQLHEKVLKDIPLENISYNQDPRDAVQAIQRAEANVAFLLPPPDKDIFARLCKSGTLLPQKSTYFYPKVITGFVMRSLEGEV